MEGEPKEKRKKLPIISESIFSDEFKTLFSRHWHSREPLETDLLQIITKPFRLCKISNFIENETFLEELQKDLMKAESNRQSTDLYQFEQTQDLANNGCESICTLRDNFTSLSEWMESSTQIKLNSTISMSGSIYRDTDFLLCHDDNMGDRRIAYVLYLSKNWKPEYGGNLDLFDTDENGDPRQIVDSLLPEYNSLIFFEVTEDSYHQVREVTSDECRLTINGWFHGPIIENKKKIPLKVIEELVKPETSDFEILGWISRQYLRASFAEAINEQIEEDSYALLSDFFLPQIYEALSEELMSEEIVWKRVGPPDKRNYEVAEPETFPKQLKEFYRLFKNIEMFVLLKAYTMLELVPDDCEDPENVKEENTGKVKIELQRWSSGCYTLLCDSDMEEEEKRISETTEQPGTSEDEEYTENPSEPGSLDVFVHFKTENAPEEESIDYVDPNEPDGAILQVPYRDNHLCLAYKTFGVKRLHRYVNHYSKGYFYTLVCTYYE